MSADADEYIQVIGALATLMASRVWGTTPAWVDLAHSFIVLAAPIADMVATGRDPTPVERQALVDYRHKLSAELQAINTSDKG